MLSLLVGFCVYILENGYQEIVRETEELRVIRKDGFLLIRLTTAGNCLEKGNQCVQIGKACAFTRHGIF